MTTMAVESVDAALAVATELAAAAAALAAPSVLAWVAATEGACSRRRPPQQRCRARAVMPLAQHPIDQPHLPPQPPRPPRLPRGGYHR